MPRKSSKQTKKVVENSNTFQDIEKELSSNQSRLSLILGALIVLVVGILVFNYFNKNKSDLGPAQQTEQKSEDVSPEKLPGKYTIKEGDTLFSIAEKYYQDGYKYVEISKANNMNNPDMIEVGQTIEIPKLEAKEEVLPNSSPEVSPSPASSPASLNQTEEKAPTDEKGATVSDDFGPKIEGDKYTVVAGDWLSKISQRAYGDVMSYEKIANANNITNPDLIEVGTVLVIPR